jgi:hypothetical protein
MLYHSTSFQDRQRNSLGINIEIKGWNDNFSVFLLLFILFTVIFCNLLPLLFLNISATMNWYSCISFPLFWFPLSLQINRL